MPTKTSKQSVRLSLVMLVAIAPMVAAACGEPPPPPAGQPAVDSTAVQEAEEPEGRLYERALAFSTQGGPAPDDTTLVIPMVFTARAVPDHVDRTILGWITRGGSWEPFADESWRTDPSETPWRIVPTGPIRMVVGSGGALESILFRRPPRVLELELGDVLAEWTGPDGSTFRFEESSVLLGTRRFDGVALDLARARDLSDQPRGDWAFLVSGDSVQIVLESPVATEPGAPAAFRGYGRIDFRQIQWPEIVIDWAESRAFEPARRDVPSAWTIRTMGMGPGPNGRLEMQSGEMAAGTGDGPLLPVRAILDVRGVLRIDGGEYPVHGVFHHTQE